METPFTHATCSCAARAETDQRSGNQMVTAARMMLTSMSPTKLHAARRFRSGGNARELLAIEEGQGQIRTRSPSTSATPTRV